MFFFIFLKHFLNIRKARIRICSRLLCKDFRFVLYFLSGLLCRSCIHLSFLIKNLGVDYLAVLDRFPCLFCKSSSNFGRVLLYACKFI